MRYIAFAASTYSPVGGAEDLVGLYDDLEDAKFNGKIEAQEYHGKAWVQVYCTKELRIILRNDLDDDGWYDPDQLCAE